MLKYFVDVVFNVPPDFLSNKQDSKTLALRDACEIMPVPLWPKMKVSSKLHMHVAVVPAEAENTRHVIKSLIST